MTALILLPLVLLISGLALAVTGTIRHDGYGSRPGPRSHHDPFPTRPIL